MLIQTEWSTNDASLMLVQENSNRLFFDNTFVTPIKRLEHFHEGVQKLKIHLLSITSTKKVEIFPLPYVR